MSMRVHHFLGIPLTLSLTVISAVSCSSSTGGGGGSGGSGSGGGGGSGGTSLKWYTTCGDPVCGAPDAGGAGGTGSIPACAASETEGQECASEGQQCDPGVGCHVHLVCARRDPKSGPGGCPISRARYKKGIDYVSEEQLESIHDELMTMRLATWNYTGEPDASKQHFGFIIDDNPESASVDRTGDRVDLYGYASMAVAATQVQNKRIEAMETELRALRGEIAALRKQASQPGAARCAGE